MPLRKVPLVTGELYHVANRTIAGFKIFNSEEAYERMIETIRFYLIDEPPCSFSLLKEAKEKGHLDKYSRIQSVKKIVEVIAYCIMPTHIHLIIKALKEGGISKFMNSITHSYSRHFNIRYKRKGPLWEGRFGNVHIKNDYQFMHLSRYIHLNPVTAKFVNKPEDWQWSSYGEYIKRVDQNEAICNFSEYLDMDVEECIKFTNDQIGYQRELASIKHLALEYPFQSRDNNYPGFEMGLSITSILIFGLIF